MAWGMRRIAFFLIIIIIGAMVQIIEFGPTSGGLIDPNSLSNHSPIVISGNSAFTTANGVVSGKGIKTDPYIIENWSIDATNNHGIYIRYTTAYFIVRNCLIFNGTNTSLYKGIILEEVKNGILQNNSIHSCYTGIRLLKSTYNKVCNNSIRVKYKYLYTTYTGIQLERSENNLIFNNTVFKNHNGICIVILSGNNIIYNNYVHHNEEYGMIIAHENPKKSNAILNNSVYKNNNGIYIFETQNSTISNNSIYNNTLGLYIKDSYETRIFNNSKYNNTYHFRIEGTKFEHYNHTIPTNNTHDGKPVYYLVNKSKVTIPFGAGFVGLIECDNITVEESMINNNYHGILLYNTVYSTIKNSKISQTYYGIYFYFSNHINIKNNSIYDSFYGILNEKNSKMNNIYNNNIHGNNNFGISFFYSDDNTISDNTLYKNGLDGIYFQGYRNTISNNIIRNNSNNGIHVGWGTIEVYNNLIYNNSNEGINAIGSKIWIYNNSIHNNSNYGISFGGNRFQIYNNTVTNNLYGIWRRYGGYGTIYNNYFSNTNNYYMSGNNYDWNISSTPGKNIIDGPYLGGNYWSDYNGYDIDGDGLGNIYLPHGPGDHLPLCTPMDFVRPRIKDFTLSNPSTGDQFIFNATIFDLGKVEAVTVEYWYDEDGPYKNETMDFRTGDFLNGSYSSNCTIHDSVGKLFYYISAGDASGNWNRTTPGVLNVIDNDLPIIEDLTTAIPTTGDNFTIEVLAYDNINVSSVHVEFWYDNSPSENVSLSLEDYTYSGVLLLPDHVKKLKYLISAVDNSSNWNSLQIKVLNVVDNDGPSIEDLSSQPINGKNFEFEFQITDNIDLSIVYLEYWFDTDTHTNIILTESQKHEILVPGNAYVLHAAITAIDNSDNIGQLKINKPIADEIPPILEDLTVGYPETGKQFNFICSITENRLVKDVTIEYWFNEMDPESSSMVLTDNLYSLEIIILESATQMNYSINAVDMSNNSAQIEKNMIVTDVLPPKIYDHTKHVPTTGEYHEIVASFEDNIDVDLIYLEYWFENGKHSNSTFSDDIKIEVPSNARKLYYKFVVVDSSGNVQIMNKIVNITDNDAPIIVDKTPIPTTGDQFHFNAEISDNVEIRFSYLQYWFENENKINKSFNGTYTIEIPNSLKVLHYKIYASDENLNLHHIERDKSIVDNDKPIIVDHSLQLGKDFKFSVEVMDNIGISRVFVKYWTDNNEQKQIALPFNEEFFEATISLPENTEKISYIIYAMDTSDNIEETITIEINFEKSSTSPFSSGSSFWIILTIVFVVIIINVSVLFGYFMVYRKKLKKSKLSSMETTTIKPKGGQPPPQPKPQYQTPTKKNQIYVPPAAQIQKLTTISPPQSYSPTIPSSLTMPSSSITTIETQPQQSTKSQPIPYFPDKNKISPENNRFQPKQ